MEISDDVKRIITGQQPIRVTNVSEQTKADVIAALNKLIHLLKEDQVTGITILSLAHGNGVRVEATFKD